MLKALDHAPHSSRLSELVQRFRIQELALIDALDELQTELDFWQRDAQCWIAAGETPSVSAQRCTELQSEWEEVAIELVHVRLAIAGATEEMEESRRSPFVPASLPA